MASHEKPQVGDSFIPALESEILAKKVGAKSRSLKPLKIKEVHHESQQPAGVARTWSIKIGDTCYDAAWSDKAKAWVYGGANSGIKG